MTDPIVLSRISSIVYRKSKFITGGQESSQGPGRQQPPLIKNKFKQKANHSGYKS